MIIATAENFHKEVIEASIGTPVLVDFWAEWCAPCKQLLPILERLADDYRGRLVVAKVNTDEQQALAGEIGVRSLPTVVLFKDGQVVDHFIGAVPEGHVRQMLERHIAPSAQSPVRQVRDLKLGDQLPAAVELLTTLLAKKPDDLELLCELAEVKALSGDLDGAHSLSRELTARNATAVPVKRLAALLSFGDVLRDHPDAQAVAQQLEHNAVDLDARHALAVHRLMRGDHDAALEHWLAILRTNRRFRDDLARKSLIQAFEVIGNADPRVAQARRDLARIIF